MDFDQQATNFAHELLIVYLLHSLSNTSSSGPAAFLNDLESAVLETLPTMIAMQQGPPGIQQAVEDRITALISVARNSIPE